MTDNKLLVSRWGGTATVVLLAFLLFYFPSVLTLMSPWHEPNRFTFFSVLLGTFYTLIFCVNYFWLVPSMLIRNERNPLYYVTNVLIILAACSVIYIWFETHGGIPTPPNRHMENLSFAGMLYEYFRFFIRDGIMMVLSAALAYAMRLSRERENVRRRALELNAEKRELELLSLKAQLNPHFLFNSLNNIYALIGFAPERARKALHDLSNMLRFMIYDAGNASVPLSKETRFISDYVALMRLRLNNNIEVECDIPEVFSVDIDVAPLLFLTLVENAFKHVAPVMTDKLKGFIRISILLHDRQLTGIVVNTYDSEVRSQRKNADGHYGVGLENVMRQLRLLYPDRHKLVINDSDNIYSVELSITL